MAEPDSDPEVDEALRQLRLGNAPERLAAARLLGQRATQSEVDALVRIRRREMDHYVERSIDDAIAQAETRGPRAPHSAAEAGETMEEQPWDDEAYVRALSATTASLVHELRRPLGLARLAAGHEDVAKTVVYLERMERLLDAMEQLVEVATGGVVTEFDLAALVTEVAAEQADLHSVPVDPSDPAITPVVGNRGAVELIVRNGIANACESTQQVGGNRPRPVVVTCGRTDRDAWVAILDHGVGLPSGLDPFAFAATRKEGHDGVGLALARQAARSLAGSLSLAQRDGGGATLSLSWPFEPS